MKQVIFLDTETTGLSPSDNEITEIAAIKIDMDSYEIIDEFQTLIKISGNISQFITNLTGITNKMLKTGESISSALTKLNSFCGDLDVYAHFASFDKKFIRTFLENEKIQYIETKWIDTIPIIRKLLPNNKNYKLNTLIQQFGLAEKESHRALDDAKHTLEIIRILNGGKYEPKLTYPYMKEQIFKKLINEALLVGNNVKHDIPKISLSYLLNKYSISISNSFKIAVKKYNKTIILRGRKQLVVNPYSLVGTAMDQMVEYFYDRNSFIKRIQNDSKVDKEISMKLSTNLNVYDFIAIAYSISYFRGGNPEDKKLSNIAFYERKADDWYLGMFRDYFKLAQDQAKYLNNANKIVFNPIFGSPKTCIKADGDYIIDGKLCEMKCSKKPSFLIEYQYQLIAYILLNEYLDKKYELSQSEVLYWNPVYDIFETKQIVINDEIRHEFLNMISCVKGIFHTDEFSSIFKQILEIERDINQRYFNTMQETYTKKNIKDMHKIYTSMMQE